MTPSGLTENPLTLCPVSQTGGALFWQPMMNFKVNQIKVKEWKPDIYTESSDSCDPLASAFTLTDWPKTGSQFPRPPPPAGE